MKNNNKNIVNKLTPKEQLFVREYLFDLNASAACLRAGYKTKNSNVVGPRLLARVGISEAIQKAMDERQEKTGIRAENVLKDIDAIKANAMRLDDSGFMIDRNAALKGCELLGRHLKLFTDKSELDFKNQINLIGNFQINLVEPPKRISD